MFEEANHSFKIQGISFLQVLENHTIFIQKKE